MYNLGLVVTVITKTFSKMIVNGSPTWLFTLFMFYCNINTVYFFCCSTIYLALKNGFNLV